jgi:RecA-family ATPase
VIEPLRVDAIRWAVPDEDTAICDLGAFPDSWLFLDDVELMTLADPQWIIADILQERAVGVVYGPSGAAKTTLIAGLHTAIATGQDWLGMPVRQSGCALYNAAEDAQGYKVRQCAAKTAAHIPLGQAIGCYTFPEAIDIRDSVSVNRFIAFVSLHRWPDKLRVVTFDTYAASTPGANENSAEDTTASMVNAQRIRDRLDATVILVHHTNVSGARERGHTAMRGAADFMFSMTLVDDVIHLECSKQRNAAPFDKILLKLVPAQDGTGCVLRRAEDVIPSLQLTPMQIKALAVLRDNFSAEGATKTEWAKCCQDVPERTFYRACKVLLERAYVKQLGTHFRWTGKS